MAKSEIYPLDDIVAATEEAALRIRCANPDGSLTLQLDHPVQVPLRVNGTETIKEVSELTIRRPNGADLRALLRVKNDEEQVLIMMFTRLTGEHVSVFDRLDFDDVARFTQEAESFLNSSLLTGPTS
jgi:hypothetical protein